MSVTQLLEFHTTGVVESFDPESRLFIMFKVRLTRSLSQQHLSSLDNPFNSRLCHHGGAAKADLFMLHNTFENFDLSIILHFGYSRIAVH